MTTSTPKASKWPLIVGIVSAVCALFFLNAGIRSLLTYNGRYHTNAEYTPVNMLTLNPDGTPHDLNKDLQASMAGQRPHYICRHIGHYSAYTHSDMAKDEYELNCFGLFGSSAESAKTQRSSYDVWSDNTSPEVLQMIDTQRDLALKRLEQQSAETYRSIALRWTQLNGLMFLFFAAMAWLWIARYRHLKRSQAQA